MAGTIELSPNESREEEGATIGGRPIGGKYVTKNTHIHIHIQSAKEDMTNTIKVEGSTICSSPIREGGKKIPSKQIHTNMK